MKKYLAGAILLFALLFAQTSDVFASCGANLTIDLQKQSRDYFTEGQVTILQNFLKDRGFLQSDVTGFFGNDTYSAVRGYQIANGISPASGFVGALTRASINSAPCGSAEVSVIDEIIGGNQPAVLGVSTSDSHIAAAPRSTVTVTSPNGGEKYKAGEKMSIKLSSTRYYSGDVVSLYIAPVKGSLGQPVTLVEKLAGNSFKWKIPGDIVSGEYVVRARLMSCYEGADTCYVTGDDSDASIYITGIDTPPSTGLFTRNLTVGSTGNEVVMLQDMLISGGYLVMEPGSTKGYFGIRTQEALKNWQKAKGISPADGYFGPASRAVANSSTVPNSPLFAHSIETLNAQSIYSIDKPFALSVRVLASKGPLFSNMASDISRSMDYVQATPDNGFAVGVYVHELDARGNDYSLIESEFANYTKSDQAWNLSMKVPFDVTKKYSVTVHAFCDNTKLGCGANDVKDRRVFSVINTGVLPRVAQARIIDSASVYNVKDAPKETMSFRVAGTDSNGMVLMPKNGFNVQANIEQKDFRGNWTTVQMNGKPLSINAIYAERTQNWVATFLIPVDTSKEYRASASAYCSMPNKKCSDNQIDMQFLFKVVNASEPASNLIASGIEIDNLKTSYKVGAPVVYKIEGETKSQSVSNWLRTATPSQGFATRAAIEEYDAVGKQWFTRSNLINTADMYATGVWDGKDRWDIKMKAPLDATKTYRVRSIVYCANRALGCISGEGAVAVDTQAITVTVDTPPVVVTTPLPTTPSESDVINNIKSDAQKIKSALASYRADNGAYPPGEMPISTLVSSKYLGKYLSSTPKFSVEGITSFPVDASSAVYYYARSENGLQCGKGGTDKSFVAESKDLPYILLFNAKPDTAEKSYYEPAKYFNRAWFSKRDMYPAHWSYCL